MNEISADFIEQLSKDMETCFPTEEVAQNILKLAAMRLAQLPTLVEVNVPPGATLHVVGDLHGQYQELLQVLRITGPPCLGQNYLVFNGDFVDRGPMSVEVSLLVFSLALAYPGCVHLNRGNHETPSLNKVYGFEEEVMYKYSPTTMVAFHNAFRCLPLATVINRSVLVLHGGLFRRAGVTLRDICAIDRMKGFEPQNNLAQDILWSDPAQAQGKRHSPRGAGILFGPDVSERFCQENGLLCCIRSHEVVQNGYEWHHGGRCLTIFSAANYAGGRCDNLGAVCHITPHAARVEAEDFSFTTFAGGDVKEEEGVTDSFITGEDLIPSSMLRSRL